MIALLLAGSLALTGCGDDYLFIGAAPVSTDNQADFVIEGLRMSITRDGRPIQELQSHNAVLKATQGRIEMSDVTVLIFDKNNEVEGTLKAREGVVYITESNFRDKNDIDLLGNVSYDGVDGTYFRTDRVHFYNETDMVESNTAVEQGRQMENSMITMSGSGFQSDRWFRELKTFNAKMRIVPSAAPAVSQ